MAAYDQKKENLKKLKEADKIQDKTLAALARAERDAAETEQLGADTFDELARQGDQMDLIRADVAHVNTKLDTSKTLQRNFDNWAGNFFGTGHINSGTAAIRKHQDEYFKVKEVFEDQKFDSIFRSWSPHGLVLCSDPDEVCTDLFDPKIAEHNKSSSWIIDYSMANIDAEGWTYAFDFSSLNKSGEGEAAPKMNSFVRRRKWRFAHGTGKAGSPFEEMVTRNDERKVAASAHTKHVDNIGYVPRDKQTSVKDTGLSSAGMMGSNSSHREELDEQSAAGLERLHEKDARIDAGIEAIDHSIDNIGAISRAMKNELTHQNDKLDALDEDMDKNAEKHHDINARQRYLLNTN